MKEKNVFLLLSDTGTILTSLIKAYTRKPYNHASIAFDRELNEVYSFGRKKVNNPFIGGFVREDMNSYLFQRAKCAIYSLTVTEDQWMEMKQYIQEIEDAKDYYHYNLLGLIGVMLNRPIYRKNTYFCSQFVAALLKKAKVSSYTKHPALIKPCELPNMADFQLIFEGKLIDYIFLCTKENIASFELYKQNNFPFQSGISCDQMISS